MGFGTGLNALITLIESKKKQLSVQYTGVEAYPVSSEELQQLNYCSELQAEAYEEPFLKMHAAPWEIWLQVSDHFKLLKQQKDFLKVDDTNGFDLIYFDAFGARVQPELWTEDIFGSMFRALRQNGVLFTYASK